MQIIPHAKSASQRMSEAFGDLGSDLSQSIPTHIINKQNETRENDALSKFTGIDFSGLDPEQKKIALTYALQGKSQEEKNAFAREMQGEKYGLESKLQQEKFGHQKELANEELSRVKPQSPSEIKQAHEEEETKNSKDIAQKSFNGIVGIVKRGNVGLGSGIKSSLFGGKRSEDMGKFKSLLGGLESMLTHMVTKGTLSDQKFKYIKNDLLPSPTDRKDEIIGKLKGIAELLGLDASSLGVDEDEPGIQEGSKQDLSEIFG